MKPEPLPRIASPAGRWWQHVRVDYLPGISMVLAVGAVVWLWPANVSGPRPASPVDAAAASEADHGEGGTVNMASSTRVSLSIEDGSTNLVAVKPPRADFHSMPPHE